MELVIRLFVVFQILALVISTTRLKIDASNCDGPQKTVIYDASNTQNITSHCYCEIKSNFTGELILASDTICSPGFYVFDNNGKFNETICDHKAAHFRKNVSMGDKVKLVFINNSSFQSGNSEGIVKIYAGYAGIGLFSVTCGSAADSIGRTTIPTLVTGTFEYRYAVAAESIVIVVAVIIFLFLYIRKKTRASNKNKEETTEGRTFDHATNGIERPENVDSNEQQQLPNNPLFQLYQINDDGGYSTCRIENIGYTEHLPDDTLYHIYE
uniref:Uncharacterized protein LOC111102508 isoform X1 n=1 Tax=Crassostrea virginica TaxID=6565 RepID=A0A8B8AHL5_CRAVI|nr:uncharacterized protein LOC111102508 isoform X1 [Crassostrea virginica]